MCYFKIMKEKAAGVRIRAILCWIPLLIFTYCTDEWTVSHMPGEPHVQILQSVHFRASLTPYFTFEELETNYYKGAFLKLLPRTLTFDLYIKHSVHYNWVFNTFIYAFIHLTILSADFEPGAVLDTRDKASTISLPYGVDSQVGERYNPLNKWIN